MDLKVKKRRPKTALEAQSQDAGEHQANKLHKLSIGGNVSCDKMSKKWWWSMINTENHYYGILKMSNLEARQISEKMTKGTRFQSHSSFSRAREYVYAQIRFKIDILMYQAKKFRYLKKADCGDS